MGAEVAANAAGTIPKWDGGLTKPVAGYVEGGHYPPIRSPPTSRCS